MTTVTAEQMHTVLEIHGAAERLLDLEGTMSTVVADPSYE